MARPASQHLESFVSSLECPGDLGRDADRVHRPDLHDLVVELHPPRAGEDDVDLLSRLVAMGERLPATRLYPVEDQAGGLRLEVVVGEARPPALLESDLRRQGL